MFFFAGTFVKYDPVRNIDAPKFNGFAGGLFYGDKSVEYVAYGNFSSTSGCAFQNPSPGYIRTVSGNAGLYLACGQQEEFIPGNGFYLLKHPNLLWVNSNITTMTSLPGALKVNNNETPFMYGRIMYSGYYYVGKLHSGSGACQLYIETATGCKHFATGFQVLTCSP